MSITLLTTVADLVADWNEVKTLVSDAQNATISGFTYAAAFATKAEDVADEALAELTTLVPAGSTIFKNIKAGVDTALTDLADWETDVAAYLTAHPLVTTTSDSSSSDAASGTSSSDAASGTTDAAAAANDDDLIALAPAGAFRVA